MLNETASAQNYELESKTTGTYSFLQRAVTMLPADETGLSNYYLLFNAWIRWLADWDNYSLNLLHRRRLIGHLNRELGIGKFSLEIYPFATRLYCVKPTPGKVEIQLHESIDHMTDPDCRRFACLIRVKHWNELRQLISEYQAKTPQARELAGFFRDTKANPTHENRTRGRYYDLETVFSSCNRRNFGGKIPRPKVLHWSPKVNHSTMGSYNIREDILMINSGLDRRDVPEYVLDFVMYHELLHKVLGVKTSGSRRMSHTKEFRELEKAHPYYEQAQAFIQKLARKL